MSATVTLDRQTVIDLLVAIHAVQDALEAHAGVAGSISWGIFY
jgi:hypothetical protein